MSVFLQKRKKINVLKMHAYIILQNYYSVENAKTNEKTSFETTKNKNQNREGGETEKK
jgi:hypothetical protein